MIIAGAGQVAEPAAGPAGSRRADGAPIDLKYLRSYTMGDPALEREVLQLFCEHVPAVLAELTASPGEKAWRQAAHTIKGSALSLGAWRIARIAEQIEASGNRCGDREELVTGLAAAIDEACRFIERL